MADNIVSHCEPADCGYYCSVNSLARPDGNKTVDWSFLFSATYTDDCIKFMSVTSFNTGKRIDEIANNVVLLI